MRLLDLFCGAGGCAMGYHRAGFEVIGVDIVKQKNYPFPFVQADALNPPFDLSKFDAIHASPPCQDHMRKHVVDRPGTGWILPETRKMLAGQSVPWVIENVPGAKMRVDFKLCGCLFKLPNLRRERWFETSWAELQLMPQCLHLDYAMSVTGTNPGSRGEKEKFGRWPNRLDWNRAMGIDWMTVQELTQAIPPAYTEFIGRQLMEHLRSDQ